MVRDLIQVHSKKSKSTEGTVVNVPGVLFSLGSGGVMTRLVQNREIGSRESGVPRIHLDDEPGQ